MSGLNRALEAIQQKTDDLFAFEVDGIEIVFRLPAVKIAEQYSTLLNIAQTESEKSVIYETMFRSCVQDEWLTSEAAELKAGIPETVARLILRLSGLDEAAIPYTEELFALYRQQSNSTMTYMKRMICMVFPGYTFEVLDKLNYQNLVNVFIQAEPMLLKQGIIEKEHDFTSPESAREAPFAVEDLIKTDNEAYKEYDSASQDDPRKLAHMQKLRENARKRAENEEREFQKRYARRQG